MERHVAERLALVDAVVEAQRGILRARNPSDVTTAIRGVVHRFGGELVAPEDAPQDAIHLDLTFGSSDARVVSVPTEGPGRSILREVLPDLVEDGRAMVRRLEQLLPEQPEASPVFVVLSEVGIDEGGADALQRAFEKRLGEVDSFEGFLGLEVWRDRRDPARFVMVGWWRRREDYVAYMRSAAHQRSHERIPTEPDKPYPVGVGQFDVVAR
ncbi:MAG: antibiotic biosynthesis monooxygenase family protein [Nitriliruptorales bacterium]|nr:antibiotic biosynthesis monooxygenase family protein [Nitriliruptorales bacterium]